MGGRLAFGWCVRHPSRVRGALVLAASPGLESDEERAERATRDRALARRLEREAFADFLDDWYAQPLFEGVREHREYPALLERRRRGHPSALAAVAVPLGLGSQPPLWEDLARGSTPIVFVAGERDPRYCAIGQALAARAPRVRFRAVPGASHPVHLFAPREVAAEVSALVRSEEA
jgi:2-succinyl-6-hydroxy-2,4-cyclohexadiene-1-carboxylate synthase